MVNTNLRNEQVWLAVGSLMILATVALAAGLIYTRGVMIPFVLAIFITTIVSPVVDFEVSRLRFPRPLAIFVALLLALAILVLLGAVLMVAVQTIVRVANEYSDQIQALTKQAIHNLNDVAHRIGSAFKIEIDDKPIVADIQSTLPRIISDAVGTITSLLSSGFLIMIFVIFLLIGRDPNARHTGIYADIEATIRSYIATKSAISAVTGLLIGLILWRLGMPMAWLFGVLACLLNFIPNIGSIAATLLPIPIAVTHFESPWMVLAVVGIPGLIHMSIGNFVEPKLMGRGLELHPVTVLLALAFWGLLWGVIGMVLAVPIVATIRIVVSRFSTTRWLGDLMAGRLPGTGRTTSNYLGPVDKPAAIA